MGSPHHAAGPRLHEFKASCGVEERHAPALLEILRRDYQVQIAPMADQWRGIDAFALDEAGCEWSVDFKCDEVAAKTGNLFIETVSNSVTRRRGWALTSEADFILYFEVPHRVVVFDTKKLRAALPGWDRFPTRAARNAKFNTLGLCVPFAVAEQVAEYVARIDKGCGLVLQRSVGGAP